MFASIMAGLAIQAATAPQWSAPSSLSVEQAATCVEANVRGKRLGMNIMTLRPARYALGVGEVIEVGPGIRFVVTPKGEGSEVALYSPNWTARLASFVRPCVALDSTPAN